MSERRRRKGLLPAKQAAPLFTAPPQGAEGTDLRGIDYLAGREYVLELEGTAAGGELTAQGQEGLFFVDVGCPGQKVLVRAISSSKGVIQARRLEVLSPAPEQAEAFCPHFGSCGGCQWQEIPYARQLELKQASLSRALIRGGFSSDALAGVLKPLIPSPEVRHFRARMEFAFGPGQGSDRGMARAGGHAGAGAKAGPPVLGLRRRGSHEVVAVEDCPVAPSRFLDILQLVREWARRFGLGAYAPGGGANAVLRFLNLRISRSSGKIAVELITFPAPIHAGKIRQLGQRLLAEPDVASFTHMSREAEDHLAVGEQTHLHLGDEFLREDLGGFACDLPPGAFFQTNIGVAALLQQVVLAFAAGQCRGGVGDALPGALAQAEAWDLYSGVGALALPLAPLFKKVAGFELSAAAVQAARHNARLNGFANCVFEAGEAHKLARRYSGSPQLVVLDPPRAGLAAELVKTLLLKKIPRLIYVSCNPQTLARDLRLLSEKYELCAVQGLDMFPHTHHLEAVVLMSRVRD